MSEVYDFQAEKLLRRAINDSLALLENADWRGTEATIAGLRTVYRDPAVQWATKRERVTRVGDKVLSITDLLESVDASSSAQLETVRRLVSKEGRRASSGTRSSR